MVMPSSQKEVDDGVTDKKDALIHLPARAAALDVCASANACVLMPARGDTRGLYAALFVALSPAFTLFVQPRGVSSQAFRNGALDGSLALWIAHSPGNGDCIPAVYSKDHR